MLYCNNEFTLCVSSLSTVSERANSLGLVSLPINHAVLHEVSVSASQLVSDTLDFYWYVKGTFYMVSSGFLRPAEGSHDCMIVLLSSWSIASSGLAPIVSKASLMWLLYLFLGRPLFCFLIVLFL